MSEERALLKKVCMLGAYAVGKTSLVRRFVESKFTEKYHSTVGVKIDRKQVSVDGRPLTLVLWDLAGEDELQQVRASHVRGAAGCFLVVDGTRPGTVDTVLSLHERLRDVLEDVPCLCLLNKHDLRDDWALDDELRHGLEERGLAQACTSAKSGEGVEEAFDRLARLMLDRR